MGKLDGQGEEAEEVDVYHVWAEVAAVQGHVSVGDGVLAYDASRGCGLESAAVLVVADQVAPLEHAGGRVDRVCAAALEHRVVLRRFVRDVVQVPVLENSHVKRDVSQSVHHISLIV